MKSLKRFRTLVLIAFILTGIIAFPVWTSLAATRQHQLDADLLTALNWNNEQEVKSLLEQGADPNARDLSGVKPGSLLQQMIALITGKHGSEYDQIPTALCYAAGGRTGGSNPVFVKLLLDHGASITMSEKCDVPPLLCTASWGDFTSVRLLLDHGANANLPAHYPYDRALRSAIRNSDAEMLRLVLEHGAQIQFQQDNTGWNALDWARDAKLRNRGSSVQAAQVIAMLKDASKMR